MPKQRFQELRKTLRPTEFNSVEFLRNKAHQIEESDPKLSDRILERVSYLEKQGKLGDASLQDLNPSNTELPKPQSLLPSSEPVVHSSFQALKPFSLFYISPFVIFVIFPTLFFTLYQVFGATERYESQAKVIVQQPDSMATMDSGMALLSGLGVPTGGSDAELVKAYIYSNDMIKYLNDELALREHYAQPFVDYFSRIHDSDSREDLYQFYQKHIEVISDDKSGVITINSQGFDSEYAQTLSNTIVKRAEWFINSIGHQLADAQLGFIQGEHKLIEQRLAEAQKELLIFQQKYNLLDPTAEGIAMQQITYTLEGQIAVKQTEIKTLKAVMSANAPQVKGLENELLALKSQLASERNKLSQSGQKDIPVSEILSKFTDYKIKMELALQAYTSSQISLEKSRIEAYRQIKYLIVVEQATLSEEHKYPDVIYNVSLFLLLLSLFFGIGKIIISTVNELK